MRMAFFHVPRIVRVSEFADERYTNRTEQPNTSKYLLSYQMLHLNIRVILIQYILIAFDLSYR